MILLLNLLVPFCESFSFPFLSSSCLPSSFFHASSSFRAFLLPRITFNHLRCPLCKAEADHPMLEGELERGRALRRKVASMALRRLCYEVKFGNMFREEMKRVGSGTPYSHSDRLCRTVLALLAGPKREERVEGPALAADERRRRTPLRPANAVESVREKDKARIHWKETASERASAVTEREKEEITAYALEKLAYYRCQECAEPYFGGSASLCLSFLYFSLCFRFVSFCSSIYFRSLCFLCSRLLLSLLLFVCLWPRPRVRLSPSTISLPTATVWCRATRLWRPLQRYPLLMTTVTGIPKRTTRGRRQEGSVARVAQSDRQAKDRGCAPVRSTGRR